MSADAHAPKLDLRAHVISCACGDAFAGWGAAERYERHVEFARTRAGKRSDRLRLVARGTTTARAALAWGIGRSAAYAYLRALERAALVVRRVDRGFPPEASWYARAGA